MATAGTTDTVAGLKEQLEKLLEDQKVLVTNSDQFFLIVIAIIIFFMQCGFAFLEAGSVRQNLIKLSKSIATGYHETNNMHAMQFF